MSEDRCPDCRAAVEGGRAGCQALFDEFGARAFSDARLAAVQQLVVDAYCLQHPAAYCHSATSYAAHLTRMCCGLEHGGDSGVYAAIPRWLNGAADLERPEEPAFRGSTTIADVQAASSAEEHQKLVREWAREVWQAYSAQHELARRWLQAALRVPTQPKMKKGARRR
jgi:hypothetical protein